MGRRLALIIGNSRYRDDKLTRLLAPDADVGMLAEIFLEPEVGGFDDARVLVNLGNALVRREISRFYTNNNRDDLLVLYFSGHGVLDENGQLHLAVKDTEYKLLRGTAISARFIADEMDNSRSQRHVLILDCCHSGAYARGAKGVLGARVGTAQAFEGTGFGRVVITASDATQYAWQGEDLVGEAQGSLFTRYLVQGLASGQADANGDGQITVDEWYDYVYQQVVARNPNQTPGKWSYREQGEMVIARTRQRLAIPTPDLEKISREAELTEQLEKLYTQGLSAYWLEEWDQAARFFQAILDTRPEFRDSAEKLQEVQRQIRLRDLYTRSVKALENQNYEKAATSLEELTSEAPDYKDARERLALAHRGAEVAGLYAQARELHQADEWQAVLNVFERIVTLAPEFADPDNLLKTAEKAYATQARQEALEAQYRQALLAMDAGQWERARELFSAIEAEEPGFKEAKPLLARAEAELSQSLARRERQEKVDVLYTQASELARSRKWRQVLIKIEEIRAIDPTFLDPDGWVGQAQAEIAREDEEVQRQNELGALYEKAVRLLEAERFEEALAAWETVRARQPRYRDRLRVQARARKALKQVARTSRPGIQVQWRNILLGVVILGGLAGLFLLGQYVLQGDSCAKGVLFCSDFSSGSGWERNWDLGSGWQAGQIGSNLFLIGQDHSLARIQGYSGENYRLAFQMSLIEGGMHANFRWMDSPKEYYYIGFRENYVYLGKQTGGIPIILIRRDTTLELNTWHTIEIACHSHYILVYIDERLILTHSDQYPILEGGIAFETIAGSRVLIDDIEVRPYFPEVDS